MNGRQDDPDVVDLQEAARLAGIKAVPHFRDPERPETWPSNQPGAEAMTHLDAMLGASRHGKTVKRERR